MERDSNLGERIVWRGKPRTLKAPLAHKVAGVTCLLLGAASLAFALLVSLSLGEFPARLLLFTLFATTLGILGFHFQRLWLSRVEYWLTPRHVVVKRGPFRRVIERNSVTFARICWSKDTPGVGDIELVHVMSGRTGGRRRRYSVRLPAVAGADKVWDMVCGERVQVAANHRGDRALGQRLDEGERVLWSESAKGRTLPSAREFNELALGVVVLSICAYMVAKFVPVVDRLLDAGIGDIPGALPALILAETLATLPILTFGAYLVYHAVVLPKRLLQGTLYLITDRRVLIQRDREELHLNRNQVLDVVGNGTKRGLRDVFFVLNRRPYRTEDARPPLPSVDSEDRGTSLRPVFEAVYGDAEQIAEILRSSAVANATQQTVPAKPAA